MKGNGNEWYFITPNGGFYQWNGAANLRDSSLIATLDSNYYADPSRLYLAIAPTSLLVGASVDALSSSGNELATSVVSNIASDASSWHRDQASGRSTGINSVVASNQVLTSHANRAATLAGVLASNQVGSASLLAEPARAKAFDELDSANFDELDALLNSLESERATPLQAAFSQLGSSGR
jgi:hypothetical protein